MKKEYKNIALKLTIVLAMSIFNILYSQHPDAGLIEPSNFNTLGAGTKDNPYLISSLKNLNWLSYHFSNQSTDGSYYEQTQDIHLNRLDGIDLSLKANITDKSIALLGFI
jgi:hypothetical protein